VGRRWLLFLLRFGNKRLARENPNENLANLINVISKGFLGRLKLLIILPILLHHFCALYEHPKLFLQLLQLNIDFFSLLIDHIWIVLRLGALSFHDEVQHQLNVICVHWCAFEVVAQRLVQVHHVLDRRSACWRDGVLMGAVFRGCGGDRDRW
jgi:hypothetical protein